ncbi:hypothetical protein FB451DRAFT_1368740 [Mycena latifolia]|nr:hypothetical protein FB451DRAFT_1368740 [Mycena latifolia]
MATESSLEEPEKPGGNAPQSTIWRPACVSKFKIRKKSTQAQAWIGYRCPGNSPRDGDVGWKRSSVEIWRPACVNSFKIRKKSTQAQAWIGYRCLGNSPRDGDAGRKRSSVEIWRPACVNSFKIRKKLIHVQAWIGYRSTENPPEELETPGGSARGAQIETSGCAAPMSRSQWASAMVDVGQLTDLALCAIILSTRQWNIPQLRVHGPDDGEIRARDDSVALLSRENQSWLRRSGCRVA